MTKVQELIQYFIPQEIEKEDFRFYKSQSFVSVILGLICINSLLVLYLSSVQSIADYALGYTPFLLLIVLFTFKRFGKLELYGNLIICIIMLSCITEAYNTQGLYSDAMIWVCICPILSTLFSNRFIGLIWYVLSLIFVFALYYLESVDFTNHHNASSLYTYEYMMVCFFGFYTAIFAVIFLFDQGQQLTITRLQNQKKETELQKTALQAAKDNLKIKNNDLENFAYAASHDLKEPLRMIAMYTQLLERRMEGQLSDENKEFMAFVTDGVFRMESLLNDLLLYSRMGRGVEALVEVNLNRIMLIVENILTVSIKESNCEISYQPLPTILASKTEMTQLFQNLFANSIKFKQENEDSQVSILYTDEPEFHYFTVADNGIGIAPEYQKKVFDIFTRIHTIKQYSGSGIGLSTCKKIVENMGGTIWLESEQNVGTKIHFRIPKAPLSLTSSL
jgi:signal transduction histidine kinase